MGEDLSEDGILKGQCVKAKAGSGVFVEFVAFMRDRFNIIPGNTEPVHWGGSVYGLHVHCFQKRYPSWNLYKTN